MQRIPWQSQEGVHLGAVRLVIVHLEGVLKQLVIVLLCEGGILGCIPKADGPNAIW